MGCGRMMDEHTRDRFETAERSSLKDQAYQQIRKALMVGELKPGQRLSSREIAEKLGTSITPVREALLQLVAEGVLEARASASITVPHPTRAVYAELRDIRVEVEGLGAARAAECIGITGITDLSATHERLMRAKKAGDFGVALRHNEAFHLGLARESGMPRLFRAVESLWTQSGPFLNFLFNGPDCWAQDGDPHFHIQVLEALRRRDAPAARSAIVEDIVSGGAGLLAKLPE